MSPLQDLLDIWPTLGERDRDLILAMARFCDTRKNVSAGHPTTQVELPRKLDSTKTAKVYVCPDCKGVIPPKATEEEWSFCPNCGCPLPVWAW